MNNIRLNLGDFNPKESQFELQSKPGVKFTICKFSLRVRGWAETKWSAAEIDEIFAKQKVVSICKIAWYMLKEKDQFGNSEENFFDEIGTVKDQFAIVTALFESIGTAEPVMTKLRKEIKQVLDGADPKPQSKRKQKRSTGEKSTTL